MYSFFLAYMFAIIIIALIVTIVIAIVIPVKPQKKDIQNSKVANTIAETQKIVKSNYKTSNAVMTNTEFAFYKELKKIANKYSLEIFPQVDLKSIIKQKYEKDYASLNRINRKSIDYTLIRNDTGLIVCCIELDDYTHYRVDRQKSDIFKDHIFREVNIPLIRQTPKNIYTKEELECLEKKIIMCMNRRQNV